MNSSNYTEKYFSIARLLMVCSRHLLLFGFLVSILLSENTPVSMRRSPSLFPLRREPESPPPLPWACNLELPQGGCSPRGPCRGWWSSHSMTLTVALPVELAVSACYLSEPPLRSFQKSHFPYTKQNQF